MVVGFQASRGEAQEWVSLERCALEARQPIYSVFFLAEDSFNSSNTYLHAREKIRISTFPSLVYLT